MRLLYDFTVLEAVAEYAAEAGMPGSVTFEQARVRARGIVPGLSAMLSFGFA